MPKPVIHDFEAIEIDEQQCQLAMPRSSTLDCQLQPLDQQQSIWKSGQPIVMGHALCSNRQSRRIAESVHQLVIANPQSLVVMQGFEQAFLCDSESE